MGTIKKSGELLKQSFRVLRQDKQLLIFPILSAAACLAVLISFATPIIATGILEDFASKNKEHNVAGGMKAIGFAISFVFYFVNYTVIVFFNTALVSCAMERFDGKTPTVGGGIRAAVSLLPQILGWALLSATVGMILRAIEERVGFIGKIVTGLIGMGWAIATYFVVPVLVVEKAGPVEAVKRSAMILKKSWGASLVSNVGLGLINFGLVVLCAGPVLLGLAISIWTENFIAVILGGAITIVLLIMLSLVMSAMQTILVAALYRFASGAGAPSGFDAAALQNAFRPKKPDAKPATI